jgi:hypothetical protein
MRPLHAAAAKVIRDRLFLTTLGAHTPYKRLIKYSQDYTIIWFLSFEQSSDTLIQRNPTREVKIGSIAIGANHPIAVQSMCATPTRQIEDTLTANSKP